MHEVVCEAGAEMERARKENKEPEPGLLTYVALGEDYEATSGPRALKQRDPVNDGRDAAEEHRQPNRLPDEHL